MKQLLPILFSLVMCFTLNAQTTILDFESAATSTNLQYFGSTLDGTLNNIIANPDASGSNTSAMVADHIKPAGAEVWAGGFTNPDPGTVVDMAEHGEICMDVWFNAPGSVSLKLENSTNGGANWITTQTVDEAQSWTQVCFDGDDVSIEDPFAPSAGSIYTRIVLFFDFGEAPAEERTYYYDNIVTQGMGPGSGDVSNVTFQVDMNGFTDPFTTVFVSGSLNGWAGTANPMEDADMDGIWEATIPLMDGPYEYKFTMDDWAVQEEFMGGEECIITDPSGEFHNRALEVAGDETVCFEWNTCISCLPSNVRDLAIDHSLFSLSPNPSSDFTILNFSDNLMSDKTVRFFNTTGALLSETNINAGVSQHEISLTDVAPGMYIVSVQTSDKLATQKLIVE